MPNYFETGAELRLMIKNLVYVYMQSRDECRSGSRGMRQSDIFRNCGLDWGNYKSATSTHQMYWLVGLLRELQHEKKIQRNEETKLWRLH